MNDDLDLTWSALVAVERRTMARFDPVEYGRCDVCTLGPTRYLVLAGVSWFACELCGRRWARPDCLAGIDLNAIDTPLREMLEDLRYADLVTFSHCDEVDRESNHGVSRVRKQMIAPDGLPLEQFAVRVRDRERAKEAAAAGREMPPPMTAEELATGRAVLQSESKETHALRERLMERYGAYAGSAYVFPVAGFWLTAEECSERLEAGADYGIFYRALFQGENRKVRR